MAKIDRVAELRLQLAGVLAAGESVRCALTVDLTAGADEARLNALTDQVSAVAQPYLGTDDEAKGRARRAAEAVVGGAVSFLAGDSPIELPELRLPDPNGVGVRGSAGSLAVQLRDWLNGPGRAVLAVTDRRAVVLRDRANKMDRYRAQQASSPAPPYELVGQFARQSLRSVRRVPKLLTRGRCELAFVDGSLIAISALNAEQGKELVAAFGLDSRA